MELRTLRAFVEVVRQGGFSAASRRLMVSQSAVSKAVRQLESDLGVTLLDRTGHRAVMTAAGEIAYARGLQLLSEREALLAELDDVVLLKRGTLRLGLPPVGSAALFAPLFALYRQRYPGVDIRLSEDGGAALEGRLRGGEIELAGALLPTLPEFDHEPVRCEPLMALLPADHPLGRRRRLQLRELESTPFIIFSPGFALHRILLEGARKAGFEPSIAATTSQLDFMVELVSLGMGVAFLPRGIAAERKRPSMRLVRLTDPGTEWSMAMAWRRGSYLSQAARAWLDLVREVYGAP